jgi:hypothetical protein
LKIFYTFVGKKSDMTEQEKELTLLEAMQEAKEAAGLKRSDGKIYKEAYCAISQAKRGKLGPIRAAELLEAMAPGKYEIVPVRVRRKT